MYGDSHSHGFGLAGIHRVDGYSGFLQFLDNCVQIPALLQIDKYVAVMGMPGCKTLHIGKRMQRNQHHCRNQYAALHKSDSHRQPDTCAGPERSRGGQPPHPVPGHNDSSHADKAHSADDLRRQPAHIGQPREIHLDVLLRQHNQRCPETDYRNRLGARAPMLHPPVQTYDAAQNSRYKYTDQYILQIPFCEITKHHRQFPPIEITSRQH